MGLRFLFLLVFGASLTACTQEPIDVYLFGPSPSCLKANDRSKCRRLTLYEEVEVSAFKERQEVVYVRTGVASKTSSSSVFGSLQQCKVVDKDNFSCDGLVRRGGEFVETGMFGDLFASESYWTFAYANILGAELERSTIQLFHNHRTAITAVLVVAIIVTVIAAN
jgi:hypothetical protein